MTEHCVKATMAITAVVTVEDLCQSNTYTRMFIIGTRHGTVVKIAAAGQMEDTQQRRQRIRLSEGISDLRFFSVCQSAGADARAFFIISSAFFSMSCSICSCRTSCRSLSCAVRRSLHLHWVCCVYAWRCMPHHR